MKRSGTSVRSSNEAPQSSELVTKIDRPPRPDVSVDGFMESQRKIIYKSLEWEILTKPALVD